MPLSISADRQEEKRVNQPGRSWVLTKHTESIAPGAVPSIDIDQFSDTIDSKVESSSNRLAPSTTALSGSLLIDTGRPISLLM